MAQTAIVAPEAAQAGGQGYWKHVSGLWRDVGLSPFGIGGVACWYTDRHGSARLAMTEEKDVPRDDERRMTAWLRRAMTPPRHCEERSDEAIHALAFPHGNRQRPAAGRCAALAMTGGGAMTVARHCEPRRGVAIHAFLVSGAERA